MIRSAPPPLPQSIGKLSKPGANTPASYMPVKLSNFLAEECLRFSFAFKEQMQRFNELIKRRTPHL